MQKRAHADRCKRLPEALPDDMDLMIEVRPLRHASRMRIDGGILGEGQGTSCAASI